MKQIFIELHLKEYILRKFGSLMIVSCSKVVKFFRWCHSVKVSEKWMILPSSMRNLCHYVRMVIYWLDQLKYTQVEIYWMKSAKIARSDATCSIITRMVLEEQVYRVTLTCIEKIVESQQSTGAKVCYYDPRSLFHDPETFSLIDFYAFYSEFIHNLATFYEWTAGDVMLIAIRKDIVG